MKQRCAAFFLASVICLSLLLSACGGGGQQSNADIEPVGLDHSIADTPVLLTSVGQSPDVEMVKVLLERVGIEPTVDNRADGSELYDAQTLVLAVGGSAKGLGAAGTNADQEIDRVECLTAAADEAGLTIIAIHLGGTARRGELSDRFIVPSFEKADYAIVVDRGDKDGFMASLAAEHEIPMDYTSTIVAIEQPLSLAFGAD